MIIVPVKEGENIEKALKKFKRKFEKTGVVKELRRRQQFDKPSVLKRHPGKHGNRLSDSVDIPADRKRGEKSTRPGGRSEY